MIENRPIPIVSGGLNEAAADIGGMELHEALRLKNSYFDTPSTLSIRRGSVDGDLLQDDGTPDPVTSVPFHQFFPSQRTIFVVGHSTVTDKHYVYETTTAGKSRTSPGNPIAPVIIPTNGGFTYNTALPVRFAGTGWFNKRFYVADVDGLIGMLVYNGDTGVVTFPNFTLGAGPASPLRPRKLFSHKNHLIALGYGDENTPFAPDILRSSAIGNPDDWPITDFFNVGDTDEPLINGLSIGEYAILFKEGKIFRMGGSSRESWTFTAIDPDRGGVGPNCATYYDDYVWFLAAEGFARIGLQGPSELFVDKAKLSFASFDNVQNCWVDANPPERMIVFACHEVGSADTFPNLLVQVDTRTGRFVTREYLEAGPAAFISFHGARVPQVTALAAGLGPSGPPTIQPATMVTGTGWQSNWTNGDVTAGTTTRHESRNADSGAAFAQDAQEDVPAVATAVTGKTPGAIYEERVRHERNGIYSIYSPVSGGQEVKTDPPLAPTINIQGASLSGINLQILHTNQPDVGDLKIEMAIGPNDTCPIVTPVYSLVLTIPNAPQVNNNIIIGGILCSLAYQFRAKWVRAGFTDSAYSAAPCVVACTGTEI